MKMNYVKNLMAMLILTPVIALSGPIDVEKILLDYTHGIVIQEFDLERRNSVGQDMIIEKMVPVNFVEEALELDRSLTEEDAQRVLKDTIFKNNQKYILKGELLEDASIEIMLNDEVTYFERTLYADPKSGVSLLLESTDYDKNHVRAKLIFRTPSVPGEDRNLELRKQLAKDVERMAERLLANLQKVAPRVFKFKDSQIVTNSGNVSYYRSSRQAGYNIVEVRMRIYQPTANPILLAEKVETLTKQLNKQVKRFHKFRKLEAAINIRRSSSKIVRAVDVENAVRRALKK